MELNSPRPSYHTSQDGFVLVAVIWMAGLLAVLSTAFVLVVRSHTLIARNTVYNGRAEYIADGVAKMMTLRLAANINDGSMKLNGEQSFCQWSPDVVVGTRIQDQGGLVDVNVASPNLVSALVKGLGLPESVSSNFQNDLQDYRDADTVGSTGGNEPKTYEGKNFGPKNAPLSVVEEIDQVPHMNDDLMYKLLPLTTIYSQQQGFDPARAPKELLAALGAIGPNDPKLATFTSPSPSKTFAIDVVAETSQHARYFRHAIIALVQQPDRPFAILTWQQGRNTADWLFPKKAAQPCIN